MQWLVDARTPAAVLDGLTAKLQAHYEAHEGEFSKAPSVSFSGAADPIKVQLSVSFELSHNGMCLQSISPTDTLLLLE